MTYRVYRGVHVDIIPPNCCNKYMTSVTIDSGKWILYYRRSRAGTDGDFNLQIAWMLIGRNDTEKHLFIEFI